MQNNLMKRKLIKKLILLNIKNIKNVFFDQKFILIL